MITNKITKNNMEKFMIKRRTEEILAYTESLAIQGVSSPTVLIWQEPETVAALGISQSAEVELNMQAINKDNVRIVRRQSGGGAVILRNEVLCFEVIAPIKNSIEDMSIRESFQYYTQPLIDILKTYNLEASISGISDITIDHDGINKKNVGCAQLRKRKALVVHASILINLDMSILERYLRFPSDVPDYRQGRSHTDFCINLDQLIPEITPIFLYNELAKEFTTRGWNIISEIQQDNALYSELLSKKYTQESWNIERKRPKIAQY